MTPAELIVLSKKNPVLFYDGVCGLCSKSVDWVIAHDVNAVFRFAPLQGSAALALDENDRANLSYVVVMSHGQIFRRSDAVIEALSRLGGVAMILAGVLQLIPKPVRDLGYDLIARHRYRIWGRSETCRLPTKDERARFLD